jgi:hypothetical protein
MAPKIPKPLQEKRKNLHEAVGDAIGRWANLEAAMATLFAVALRLEIADACKLLVHIKTFSLKLDLLDAAVKIRIPADATARWNSIVELIRELSGDRNYLAHAGVAFHGPGDPNKEESWSKADIKVGPPTIHHFAETGRSKPLDLAEVAELVKDIQQAVDLMIEFWQLLPKLPASKQTLSTKIERRRLPRKQRQGNAPRTH